MKLATYIHNEVESWGFILPNPLDEGKDYIFNPKKAEDFMRRSGRGNTTPLHCALPTCLGKYDWPDSIAEFLNLGPDAMATLKELCIATENFLNKNCDKFAIQFAGVALEEVTLRAPIPQPKLFLGLVANCPSFWRNVNAKKYSSLVPLVHQRPISCFAGPGDTIFCAGGNVELGVIIGKGGKNIPIDKAYEHIAGYTVVIDTQTDGYFCGFDGIERPAIDTTRSYLNGWDWYEQAACSFMGKKADRCCAFGPYIVTPEEVGNHYDLLTYTGHGGIIRDRAHTCGFSIGIERIISWYSSIAEIHPGDVFHMGTAGTDGVFVDRDMFYPGMTMESEIEHIGRLQVTTEQNLDNVLTAWEHTTSIAAEDFKKAGKGEIATADDWDLSKVNNVWITIINNKNCMETDGKKPTVSPRAFNAPRTCINTTGSDLVINKRATKLTVSVELAAVVKKLVKHVTKETFKENILGYTPMIGVADRSMWDEFFTNAAPPVNGNMVNTYARWGDGNNIVTAPKMLDDVAGRKMTLKVEGFGEITCSTDDYNVNLDRTLEFISRDITLFPGDVVTLGRASAVIEIPADADIEGKTITAEIEGLGTVTATLHREA